MAPPQPVQPRIPGVRYKREKRFRQVPDQVMGDEVMVDQEYEVDVPLPPVDLDRLLLRFVVALALLTTAVAVTWSTASIGALLSLVVAPAVAYLAAGTFEAAWITCLAVSWLLRTDPDRAKPVNIAGWIALGVVVAAVVSHGVHVHQTVAGVVGGAVSVLAKGLWTVVLRLFSVKFSPAVLAWLRKGQQESSAAFTLLAQEKRLGGQQAYMTAVYGKDSVAGALAAVADTSAPKQLASGRPDASAPDTDTIQDTSGQAATPNPEPVQDTSGQAPPPPPVQPPSGPLVSIASTVRTALTDTPDITDEDLVEHVKQRHGYRHNLAETVNRYRRKYQKPA
ncbi:hypothetical protein SUDANB1_05620 [Streptomyces sp. enrichment culture]|uniref:hypothetical protein n=1 Tax=Streptomyces sp. enrichment culture TaxID=1795815 RepID=UPI003F545A8D